jgi:hypothetical protein
LGRPHHRARCVERDPRPQHPRRNGRVQPPHAGSTATIEMCNATSPTPCSSSSATQPPCRQRPPLGRDRPARLSRRERLLQRHRGHRPGARPADRAAAGRNRAAAGPEESAPGRQAPRHPHLRLELHHGNRADAAEASHPHHAHLLRVRQPRLSPPSRPNRPLLPQTMGHRAIHQSGDQRRPIPPDDDRARPTNQDVPSSVAPSP